MDISEVARRSGLNPSTLRYYEERGLIRSVGRQAQRRVFGPHILDELALITLGRAAGFALEEIAPMLNPGGRVRIDRAELLAKADQIDAAIRQLKAVRNGLRHAAQCPEPSHLDCPNFRRWMGAAHAGALKPLAAPLRPPRKTP